MPTENTETVRLDAPFTLSGKIVGYLEDPNLGQTTGALFDRLIEARGVVSARPSVRNHPVGGTIYWLQELVYQIQAPSDAGAHT